MKRLFFYNGNGLIAYEWEKNEFKDRQEFKQTIEDRDLFQRYLQKRPKIPARILVDVIEEEFVKDKIPYVTGADRKALFERTKKKQFRAQKYRYIELQKRDKEGRKDLNIIISALLNAEGLEFFLDQIEESHIPLEGVYSLPIVGELLTPYILADKGSTLIISNQGATTLRQSYYVDGHLEQSRLSSINDERDDEFVTLLETEINSTVRFLVSARSYKYADNLNIFIIVPDTLESTVRETIEHRDNAQYSILSLSQVFKKVGTKGKLISEYSDVLYAQLLLQKTFYKNQYAPIKQRSRYYHLLIERGLYIFSAVLFVIISIYLTVAFLDWTEKEEQIEITQNSHDLVQKQLTIKQKEIVTYQYSATTTKEVVELYKKLKVKTHSNPSTLFNTLSSALINNPNIVPTGIYWLYTSTPSVEVPTKVDEYYSEPLNFKKQDLVLVRVEGKIISFEDNYRKAVQYYQRFIQDLKKIKKVTKVEDIESPFNLNSSATIEGDSGTSAQVKRKASATFAVKFHVGLN